MKVSEENNISYRYKEYGRRETVSNVDHLKAKANACIYRRLQKVNNSEKPFLQSFLSMPGSLNACNLYDVSIPGSTEPPLRRSEKLANIHHACPDQLEIKATLEYKCIYNSRQLDAVNYIYLGSLYGGPPLHQGLTLNAKGNLLLIKGKNKDLFKSGWLNLTQKAKFHIAEINLGKECALQFSRLNINHEGKLIAWGKSENVQYEINFNMDNISKEINIDTPNDIISYINVQIKKLSLPIRKHSSLQFNLDGTNSIKFFFAKGSIYLKEILYDKYQYSYDLMKYKLNLPLPQRAQILSVTKVANQVKLCIEQDGGIRIMYFSPHHVDMQTCAVKHLSHKPVQNLYSGSGADPHEKVHSGLPFDSKRLGNFSSKNIPLLSSVVDNFRGNLKKAKNAHFDGNKYRTLRSLAKAVDPGLQCLAESLRGAVKPKNQPSGLTQHQGIVQEVSQLSDFVQNNSRLHKVLSSASDYYKKENSFAKNLKLELRSLESNDSISLNIINNVALFFGIAAAGMPFVSGWFAGALARRGEQISLNLTKSESGNIYFSFIKNKAYSLVALAGTGQGLEEKGKLLSAGGIDLITWLPVEANVIWSVNAENEHNFSFEIKWCDIDFFLEKLFRPRNSNDHGEDLITDATLKKTRDKNVTLSLEAKSELRGQIGFMARANTFLVAPRTALGNAATVHFFDYAKKESVIINDFGDKNIRLKEQASKTAFLNMSLNAFHERKIMPIPMTGLDAPGQKVLCFPLPLFEEADQRIPFSHNELPRYFHLDDKTLQKKFTPLGVWEENKTVADVESSNLVGAQVDERVRSGSSSFAHGINGAVAELIESIGQALQRAGNDNHSYQSIKPGESLGSFIISPGDFKKNLQLAAKNHRPRFVPFARDATPSVRTRINQALKPWTKNTTLREYLALQAERIVSHDDPAAGSARTAFDFVRAIEKYAARSYRKSNGKRSGVTAIATYRLQKHTLDLLLAEFSQLCHVVKQKIRFGRGTEGEQRRLKDLRDLLLGDKSGKSPCYVLDSIELVRQNAITLEVSTLPFTILHITRKNGLVFSKSLSTLNIEYRAGELFPYKFICSDRIMPELFL